MSPLKQGDQRLAGRAGRGDDAAFAALAARHRDRLVRAARRRLGERRDDAEDVVQDALLNALRALRAGKRPENPGAWLLTIVANCCHDHHRAASRRATLPLLEEADAAPGAESQDPHARVMERERVAGAVRAVQALPETQREALVGYELGGRSYEELAGEHGWSVPATKSLLWRARTTLAAERDRWAAAIGTPLVALAQMLRVVADKPASMLGVQQGHDAATYAVIAVIAAGGATGAGRLVERDPAPRDAPRAAVAPAKATPKAKSAATAGAPARVTEPAAAAPRRVLHDAEDVLHACARGRSLDGASAGALRAARDGAPADLAQYSSCEADIRRALASAS